MIKAGISETRGARLYCTPRRRLGQRGRRQLWDAGPGRRLGLLPELGHILERLALGLGNQLPDEDGGNDADQSENS